MARRTNVMGTLYCLHFSPAYRHAGHYVGWTERTVEERVTEHLSGQGSPLIAAAVAAGCTVTISVTLAGTRHDERRIKNGKKTQRICPKCGGHGRLPKSRGHRSLQNTKTRVSATEMIDPDDYGF